jgi:hypothetical protein
LIDLVEIFVCKTEDKKMLQKINIARNQNSYNDRLERPREMREKNNNRKKYPNQEQQIYSTEKQSK